MQDLQSGCEATCPKSCENSIQTYLADYKAATGYDLDAKAYKRLLGSCTRRCNQECIKGGAAYDYVVNFRRY